MPDDAVPPTRDDVIAVVMAAGRSRRFGDDKRRAVLADGHTLLQATLALARRHFAQTWVVLRHGETPGELGLEGEFRVLHAPPGEDGLGISLGAAFQRLGEETAARAAAVMLGDMPWVAPGTCARLAALAEAGRILRPRHGGAAGHPVVFGRAFWPRLAMLRGEAGARAVLGENADACRFVDVDDPGILRDVDTPGDLPS